MTSPVSGTFDASFWMTAAAIALLLVFSAFFSGSETALTAASRAKLRARADKGEKGAARALAITEDNERLIGSVLLGNNLVNILSTSLATALFTKLFGANGVAWATLVMTLLVLIFAEVLPKTWAITRPESASAWVSAPIRVIIVLFSPVVAFVRALTRGLLKIVGVETDPNAQLLGVREEIAGAISLGMSEGAVEKEDRDRLLGALDLGDRTVDEIMLHRSQIEMIDAARPLHEVLEQALASRSSAEWEALLGKAGIPAGRVLDVPSALSEPQIRQRRLIRELGRVKGVDRDVSVALAGFKMRDADPDVAGAPPTLGEHTEELLGSLGYTRERIAQLKAQRAI